MTPAPPPLPACLTPGCGSRLVLYRGLCAGCYWRALGRVRRGQTTWARLVARGRALPAKGRQAAKAWNRHGRR